MDTVQAVARLLALDARHGALTAAVVEADTELAQDRAATTTAAHLLASKSEVITGEDTDARSWFPYSFIMRVEVPDYD
jgi:hypothetical protein